MTPPRDTSQSAFEAFDSADDEADKPDRGAPQPGPISIPLSAIETLFEQLSLAYGQSFLARWDGMKLPIVKEDWRYKLAGLSPEQLAWGLDHMKPGPPPEAMTFRAWCVDMPQPPEPLKLPPKRGKVGIPPAVRAAMQMHRDEMTQRQDEPERVVWARGYVDRWRSCAELTPFQRNMLAHATTVIQRWETAHARNKGHGDAVPATTSAQH